MTENQMAAYITELQRSGLEAKSARAAGVTLRTVIKHYDADPGFKELCLDALEEFNDHLEEEAIRRAVHGVEKPVFQRGECVGHITEYSDTLMAKLLTGRRPNVYGNKTEVTGANGGPLTIQIEHFDEYSDIL